MWRKFLGVGIPMLVNAGLIGAAVGAGIRSPTQSRGFGAPAVATTWPLALGAQTRAEESAPFPARATSPVIAAHVVSAGDVKGLKLTGVTDPVGVGRAGEIADTFGCPGCGQVSESDAVFCGKCGLRLAD